MKTNLLALLAISLCLSCNNNKPEDSTEAANEKNDSAFSKNTYEEDANFAVKAADGGMFEVKVAQLALQKTSNADVTALAEMMIKDHSAANEELKALAARKNITLPDSVSSDRMDKYRDLEKKSGHDFDKAYVDMMVDDHDKDINAFDKESMGGNEKDIRDWAAQKLETLRHHYDMSKQTQDKIK